jgi:hypothetical protein
VGATITLGRKHKSTGAGGRTRICRRFSKAGRPPLIATATGYQDASRRLRVNRRKARHGP